MSREHKNYKDLDNECCFSRLCTLGRWDGESLIFVIYKNSPADLTLEKIQNEAERTGSGTGKLIEAVCAYIYTCIDVYMHLYVCIHRHVLCRSVFQAVLVAEGESLSSFLSLRASERRNLTWSFLLGGRQVCLG